MRGSHVSGIVRDSIVALNSMCVGSDSADRSNSQPLTAAQEDVMAFLTLFAQRLGSPPEDMHGEGALKELFAKGGYSGQAGQSFASIEVEPGQQVWLGNVDIKVAFYAMQLPAELLKYFWLPYDVRAGDVGFVRNSGQRVRNNSYSFTPTRASSRYSSQYPWAGRIPWRFESRS